MVYRGGVHQGDALAGDGGDRYNVVLTNPPFGKKSSYTVVGEDGYGTIAGFGSDTLPNMSPCPSGGGFFVFLRESSFCAI
jgi:hypothetical protein